MKTKEREQIETYRFFFDKLPSIQELCDAYATCPLKHTRTGENDGCATLRLAETAIQQGECVLEDMQQHIKNMQDCFQCAGYLTPQMIAEHNQQDVSRYSFMGKGYFICENYTFSIDRSTE